jgi:chemosensory pili system protein ChpC
MSAQFEEIYSLLVPLANGRLIVPRAAIVEVMGFSQPRERPDGAPDWFVGWLNWSGNRIPLISFEAACGQPVPEQKQRTRIAVLQAVAGLLDPPTFAMVTQGYPYLLRVNRNVLKLEEDEAEPLPAILSRVRMANERPAIPDLEHLEQEIASVLGIRANEPTSEAVEVMPDEPTQLGHSVTSLGDAPAEDELRFDDDTSEATLEAALDDADPATMPAAGVDAPEPGVVGDGLTETQPQVPDDAELTFDDLSIDGIEVDED